MHITPEILAAASEVEIRAKRRVNAHLEGNYRSAFRGSSMQFKEFRPYEPGDDIRHMSWTVTARTGRPTVKLYEQERELDVVLIVDCSGSSLFGSHTKRKVDMLAELTATIGLSALSAYDNFGLILFNDQITQFLKPSHRPEQVRIALTYLLGSSMKNTNSHLSVALDFATRALKHRSLVIILSDYWVPEFESQLSVASRRHECILIHCVEEREMGQSIEGCFPAVDPETGEVYLVDGNSRAVSRLLQKSHWERDLLLDELAKRHRCDLLRLTVEDDYVHRLVLFFERRGPTRL